MARFLSIAELLQEGRAPDYPVAFGRGGGATFSDLRADVAALLPDLEKAAGRPWLIHADDPYAAIVALLACAHAGVTAVLAPNRLPRTLLEQASSVEGVLSDGEPAAEIDGLPWLHPLGRPRAPLPPWKSLNPKRSRLDCLTSGSSGLAKTVQKCLGHFDDELPELERCFGAQLGSSARIFATVSQQHVYGLLFRVLWPLAAGRPFARDTYLHTSEMVTAMLAVAGPTALVASPAHLKRMGAAGGLARLRGHCVAVVSSGGPLEASAAEAVSAALGIAPYEVFGSTETGGVAHRQRGGAASSDAWTPFGPVQVAQCPEDRTLEVRSPFSIGAPAGHGRARFRMGDRVELLADGRFRVLGRADRIVKIGEHRLSLPEMEAALGGYADVEEVALVPIERGPEPRSELRVGAAIVPGPGGWSRIREGGRRAFGIDLSDWLADRYSRVLLPRAWRFIETLPRDAQGKVPLTALRALFDVDEQPLRAALVRGERRGADWLERDLVVPEDLAFLAGHFPGQPVVAGVVQIGWALDVAAALLGGTPCVRALSGLKFRRVLRPGDAFVLRVTRLAPDRLGFTLGDDLGAMSSGTCEFRPMKSDLVPTGPS